MRNEKLKIVEWTEKSWNPVTGCSQISSGCKNCYAEVCALWLQNMGNKRYLNGFELTLHPDKIKEPLHWRKPRRVFVNSMSDLFHEKVHNDFIYKVFEVMNECPNHLFMVLTKRANRLAELSPELKWSDNIWMGVTVENEECKTRIDLLRNCDAACKFISMEPLLEDLGALNLDGIDWVFVGGESGKNCRVMKKEWVLNVKKECERQVVTFTFKQWGGKKRKENGALLDGKLHDEMPIVK